MPCSPSTLYVVEKVCRHSSSRRTICRHSVHTSYRQFPSALAKGTLGSVVAHHLCLARIAVTACRWQSVDEDGDGGGGSVAASAVQNKLCFAFPFEFKRAHNNGGKKIFFFFTFYLFALKRKGAATMAAAATATAINITNS